MYYYLRNEDGKESSVSLADGQSEIRTSLEKGAEVESGRVAYVISHPDGRSVVLTLTAKHSVRQEGK